MKMMREGIVGDLNHVRLYGASIDEGSFKFKAPEVIPLLVEMAEGLLHAQGRIAELEKKLADAIKEGR
jgi:hypothetical protein